MLALGCAVEETGSRHALAPVVPAGAEGGAPGNPAGPAAGAGGAGGGAAGGVGGAGGAPMAGSPGQNSWTIFVYGHADHNLSATLLADLKEMEGANLGAEVKVVVMVDWDARRTVPASLGGMAQQRFPDGHFVYLLEGAKPKLTKIAEGEELDLDDPLVLAASVKFAFKSYPASRYGVVLWDHGGAWKGGFGSDTANGTSKGNPMSAETVAQALRRGMLEAGITAPKPLEFVAFDTCLMGGVEIAAPFVPIAKTFIADAEIDYGDGWDYAGTLSWLGANPTATAVQFAAKEVELWDKHHANAGADDALLRSHVAIDLAKWPAITTAAKALADEVSGGREAAMSRAIFGSVPLYEQAVGEPRPGAIRDLGQILRRAGEGPLAAPAARLGTALRDARLGVSRGKFRIDQDGVHAMAAPARALDPADLPLYASRAATWNEATGWRSMLERTMAAADAVAPTVKGTTEVAPRPSMASPTKLRFTLSDGDVVEGEMMLVERATTNPQVIAILGILGAAFVGPGTYEFLWTGYHWVIRAQPQPVVVTMEPWVMAATPEGLAMPLFAIRGVWKFSNGDTVPSTLLVESSGFTAPAAVIASGGVASVQPLRLLRELDPKAVFVPKIAAYNFQTGMNYSVDNGNGLLIPEAGAFAIAPTPAAAGPWELALKAYDLWHNVGATFFPTPVSP